MLKRTFLFDSHLKLGAKMVPFAGWEMPVSYPSGIIAEHRAVRSSAGIFDIGHMGLIKIQNSKFKIQNDDASLGFIQRVTTNDAARLDLNQCQYSILCNEKGGVVDDIMVYHLPDFYLIVANAANTEKVFAWLRKLNGGIDVGLYDSHCMLSLQGPKSETLISQTLGISLSGLKRNHSLQHNGLMISRTGYTGEDGFEFIIAKEEVKDLWDSFIRQGVPPCGLGARDTLRLEAGLPHYGHEYDEETSPLEAGYGWAVKFDKGDFIGKSALEKEKEEGLKKKLVGIEMEGRAIPREGAPVFCAPGSELCGQVTSGTFSPTLKKPIALAYLTSEEKDVSVEIRGEKFPGKVVDKTFYKRVK